MRHRCNCLYGTLFVAQNTTRCRKTIKQRTAIFIHRHPVCPFGTCCGIKGIVLIDINWHFEQSTQAFLFTLENIWKKCYNKISWAESIPKSRGSTYKKRENECGTCRFPLPIYLLCFFSKEQTENTCLLDLHKHSCLQGQGTEAACALAH